MKALLGRIIITGLICSYCAALSAAELGETAAPLEISEWVKGDAIDLATAKGKKVLVVEFWATWCGPCRTSIPHLTEMQKKFEKRGVVFVGVSDETSAKVKPFVEAWATRWITPWRSTKTARLPRVTWNGMASTASLTLLLWIKRA